MFGFRDKDVSGTLFYVSVKAYKGVNTIFAICWYLRFGLQEHGVQFRNLGHPGLLA